jgi:hypothetical protein
VEDADCGREAPRMVDLGDNADVALDLSDAISVAELR